MQISQLFCITMTVFICDCCGKLVMLPLMHTVLVLWKSYLSKNKMTREPYMIIQYCIMAAGFASFVFSFTQACLRYKHAMERRKKREWQKKLSEASVTYVNPAVILYLCFMIDWIKWMWKGLSVVTFD